MNSLYNVYNSNTNQVCVVKPIRYDITQNIAIRYDTMHKRNVKFNVLQHGHQFVKERLQAWLVQQDDDHSETANMGTCADDLKRGRLVNNVDQQQCDMGTGDNGICH